MYLRARSCRQSLTAGPGKELTILRAYPEDLSDIILLEVSYIRRVALFIADIFVHVTPETLQDMRHFQFHGIGFKVAPAEISSVLRQYGNEHVGFPLSIRSWRQIADSIFNRELKQYYKPVEQLNINMSVHGGHSAQTRESWYGMEPGKLRGADQEVHLVLVRNFLRVRPRRRLCLHLCSHLEAVQAACRPLHIHTGGASARL